MREIFLEDDEINLILALLPNEKEVPKGLDPTFYRTLRYEDEVILNDRFQELRAKLEE